MKKARKPRPLAIRVQAFILAALMLVSVIPTNVFAKETIPKKQAEEENIINPEDIVGVEVIDGEVYIDVLEPYLFPFIDFRSVGHRSAVGKCTSEYSYTYTHMTRKEVIDEKKKCDNGTATAGILVGLLVGSANNILGAVAGELAGAPSMFSEAAEQALYNNNKSSYTVKTTFKCEDSNLGSRGWVHRYRLYAIRIY